MTAGAWSGGAAGRYRSHALAAITVAGLLCTPTAARGDVVLDWNAIAVTTTGGQNPFSQARLMAITQLAVFEAINAITGDYQPYLAEPVAAPPGASPEAAAIAAAYRVLKTYFPLNTAIDTAHADALAAIPASMAKADGIAVGEAAAAALTGLRENDGADPPQFQLPTSNLIGAWQTTASCSAAGGAFYQWKDITPFGIGDPSQFLLPAPPAVTSNRYAKDLFEVSTVGAADSTHRPEDRASVARLYAVTSPSFAASLATRQIAAAKGLTMPENARALALIMMSINDSLIASFYNKYHYNYWRPETGIPLAGGDGNRKTAADPDFTPFIVTPCFPSYPSNHASGTNAGLEMMRRLFGAAGHDITIAGPVPALGAFPAGVITVQYSQLRQMSNDVDDARVYGGIHWRFDQEAGNNLGRAIATYIYRHHLRPVHGRR